MSVIQRKIRLQHFRIKDLNFKIKEFKNSIFNGEVETNFSINFKIIVPENGSNTYLIVFKVVIDNTFVDIKLISEAIFETNQAIDEEFLNSNFVRINSPAIAFPYLRSFISTLTINAGIPPIVLPAINFTQIKPEA